ncbi:nicotinamide riboside transporter PnuC [Flavobacterium rhizosphaerae]|uniref:Nicotinamide riboside transporter PnuC n=1 Tax=Flavobacterium rhizosphaerae TaxID=3163298 RepID=A0ABW8YYE0_9FLAO
MRDLFDLLFGPYQNYTLTEKILEAVAVVLGIVSVLYSKRNSVLLYPTGLISSLIYIYLLYHWQLYGDLTINSYYVYMSIYGWVLWTGQYKKNNDCLKITKISPKDYLNCSLIFIISIIFASTIYIFFDKFGHWWSYPDIIMTGLLFVGTWLLAKRKLENWLFLIAGDVIAIPLFFIKGYALTGILNIFLTIIAIYGYKAWKKTLLNNAPVQ